MLICTVVSCKLSVNHFYIIVATAPARVYFHIKFIKEQLNDVVGSSAYFPHAVQIIVIESRR